MMTIYRDMSRTGKLAGRAIAGQARAPGSRRAATPAPLRRDLDGEPAIDLRNQLARIAARVAHDPRLADAIVARDVRVAMDPQPRPGSLEAGSCVRREEEPIQHRAGELRRDAARVRQMMRDHHIAP